MPRGPAHLAVGGGGIRALPLSLQLIVVAALAVLAVGILLVGAREQWREGDACPPATDDPRRWWRIARVLLPLQAAIGLVALIVLLDGLR